MKLRFTTAEEKANHRANGHTNSTSDAESISQREEKGYGVLSSSTQAGLQLRLCSFLHRITLILESLADTAGKR